MRGVENLDVACGKLSHDTIVEAFLLHKFCPGISGFFKKYLRNFSGLFGWRFVRLVSLNPYFMRHAFLSLLVLTLSGCSGSPFYELPALPFAIELPGDYGFLESDSSYIFSPENGPATLVFEKEPTDLAFFELFEEGYIEVTEKSSGVWVICDEHSLENCYVQNMDFRELYPLRVRSNNDLSDTEREAVFALLNTLRKD